MAINIANFVRTSLREPISPTDNVLQLALGSGAFFNFPVGDYCYITLEDRLNSEVVRFTSTGILVGDSIAILRAQDGTLARSFPAGTCVKIAWNEQQVKDLIAEIFVALVGNECPPANTIQVDGVPVGAPPSCVYYAVNRLTAPWQVYFWDGATWSVLGSLPYNGVAPIQINGRVVSLNVGSGLEVVEGVLRTIPPPPPPPDTVGLLEVTTTPTSGTVLLPASYLIGNGTPAAPLRVALAPFITAIFASVDVVTFTDMLTRLGITLGSAPVTPVVTPTTGTIGPGGV